MSVSCVEITEFSHKDSDVHTSGRARRSQQRLESLYRDRLRKSRRIRKMGYDRLEPWLMPDQLDALEGKIRDLRLLAAPSVRADRATHNGMKALKPVPLSHLKYGSIVDAWVPFADGSDYKRRPAVVVESSRHEVVIMPLTTSFRSRASAPYIHVLGCWRESGLTRASALQNRFITISRNSVIKGRCGELMGEDREQFDAWVERHRELQQPDNGVGLA